MAQQRVLLQSVPVIDPAGAMCVDARGDWMPSAAMTMTRPAPDGIDSSASATQ